MPNFYPRYVKASQGWVVMSQAPGYLQTKLMFVIIM